MTGHTAAVRMRVLDMDTELLQYDGMIENIETEDITWRKKNNIESSGTDGMGS